MAAIGQKRTLARYLPDRGLAAPSGSRSPARISFATRLADSGRPSSIAPTQPQQSPPQSAESRSAETLSFRPQMLHRVLTIDTFLIIKARCQGGSHPLPAKSGHRATATATATAQSYVLHCGAQGYPTEPVRSRQAVSHQTSPSTRGFPVPKSLSTVTCSITHISPLRESATS